MRGLMRALVYLTLPAVAFSWLLQVDFPRLVVPIDEGFHVNDSSGLGTLLIELAIGGAVLAVVIVIRWRRCRSR